jgi:hypothetical protein
LGSHCFSDLDDSVFSSVGLVRNHVYSLLDAQSVRDNRLVLLRNPWGRKEWQGDWSRFSKTWKGNEAENFYSKLAPGCFWISYEDLLRYFHDIVICKLHRDYEELRFRDSFVNGKTSHCYKLQVLHMTDLHITITQQSKRADKQVDKHPLSWILYNENKKTCTLVSPKPITQYSHNYLLEPGNYTVVPVSFSPKSQEYVLCFHYSKPILVQSVPINKKLYLSYLHKSIIDNATSPTSCHVITKHLSHGLSVYQWSSSQFYLYFIVNHSHHHTISFQCDALRCENLTSSRNMLFTTDVLFPQQQQIIMCLTPADVGFYRLGVSYSMAVLNEITELHYPEISEEDIIHSPQMKEKH